MMPEEMPNEIRLILLLELVFGLGLLGFGGFVTYMFYARLRDIANELRKIRVTYEMEQDRNARAASRSATAAQSAVSAAPSDEKYQSKRS
jgi:hypothetical protein